MNAYAYELLWFTLETPKDPNKSERSGEHRPKPITPQLPKSNRAWHDYEFLASPSHFDDVG